MVERRGGWRVCEGMQVYGGVMVCDWVQVEGLRVKARVWSKVGSGLAWIEVSRSALEDLVFGIWFQCRVRETVCIYQTTTVQFIQRCLVKPSL